MMLVWVVMEAESLPKRRGLRYQRREQFTMTAGAAVPSSRDAISETSHNHFFCSVLYATLLIHSRCICLF